jgi:hypothetical protein
MASYGAIPAAERTHRARAAPMLALMGLAAVAVVAIVTLTAQSSRAVEMVAFPQDDLGILKEMVLSLRPPVCWPAPLQLLRGRCGREKSLCGVCDMLVWASFACFACQLQAAHDARQSSVA